MISLLYFHSDRQCHRPTPSHSCARPAQYLSFFGIPEKLHCVTSLQTLLHLSNSTLKIHLCEGLSKFWQSLKICFEVPWGDFSQSRFSLQVYGHIWADKAFDTEYDGPYYLNLENKFIIVITIVIIIIITTTITIATTIITATLIF